MVNITNYIPAEIEVISFNQCDVIITSGKERYELEED